MTSEWRFDIRETAGLSHQRISKLLLLWSHNLSHDELRIFVVKRQLYTKLDVVLMQIKLKVPKFIINHNLYNKQFQEQEVHNNSHCDIITLRTSH